MRDDALPRALRLLEVQWTRAARAVFFGFLALGSAVALGAVSAWLIARASQMPPVMTLSVAVVSVRAFGISRGVFRYAERLASHDVALRGMSTLRARLYERLSQGRLDAVAPLRRGDLLARVGADVDHVGDVVVRSLIPAAISACVSLATIITMTILLPEAGAFLAIGLILAGVVGPLLTARGAARTERDSAQARSDVSALALDLVDNAAEQSVTGQAPVSLGALREADSRWRASTDAGARDNARGAALGMVGLAVAVLGALWCGIPAVSSGRLADVGLAVIVLTPLAAFESTLVLPAAASQWHRSRQAAQRLMSLWDATEPPETKTAGSTASTTVTSTTVTMAATSSRQSADELVPVVSTTGLRVGWVSDVPVAVLPDLRINDGESVMLTGASGAGKTTILATLAQILPPISGSVECTSQPILTTEDAHVFHTTVLENLRVARGEVTTAEAHKALDAVGLTGWLSALPAGLDTMLGPEGSTVSGGERRRLLIARALVSGAQILLIDEPAEHLDIDTADALVADLLRLPSLPSDVSQVRAVVVASHHLGAAQFADQVINVRPLSSHPVMEES